MILTLLTTNTTTSGSTSVFTSSIDSTYDEYMFVVTDFNPETDGAELLFNGSIDGGSNYNVAKTTTWLQSTHDEAGEYGSISYDTGSDLSQGTAGQRIMKDTFDAADAGGCAIVHLFSPASTTYVTHFYSKSHWMHQASYAFTAFVGGYFNSTDNIDAVEFKTDSGDFDAVIQMYGVA